MNEHLCHYDHSDGIIGECQFKSVPKVVNYRCCTDKKVMQLIDPR
jgi:hypothetical protein